MKTLPLDFLRACLRYDAESGVLTWNVRPREHFSSDRGWRLFNARCAGQEAGTVSKSTGYVIVNFSRGNLFPAHRVAWALHYGEWPDEFIDHRDGVRANNAIANLRVCTRSDNQANRGAQANNASGLKGAHRHAPGVWRSRVQKDGKLVDLGLFSSPEDAHAAYSAAARRVHGEFACVE